MSNEELEVMVSLKNQIKNLTTAINDLNENIHATLGNDGLGAELEQLREAIKELSASKV